MPEPAPGARPQTGFPPCLAVIDATPNGDRTHVRMHGELDLGGQRLQRDLYETLSRSRDGIDLYLDTPEFCDCAGFNILLDLRQRALEQHKTVAVRSTSPSVERLLDLTGTHDLLIRPNGESRESRESSESRERGEITPDSIDTADTIDTRGTGDATALGVPRGDADDAVRTEVDQLRRAMETRPTIDLARGMLMAAFGLSPQTAWTVLVTTSQNTNTKLHRLAEHLVATVRGAPLPEPVLEQLATAVAEAKTTPAASAAGPAPVFLHSLVPRHNPTA